MIQKYIISLPPITKKNSQQILTNHRTGKPFIAPSRQYKKYEQAAMWVSRPKAESPLSGRYRVATVFYMPTRRKVDLTNLMEAAHDTLVAANVKKIKYYIENLSPTAMDFKKAHDDVQKNEKSQAKSEKIVQKVEGVYTAETLAAIVSVLKGTYKVSLTLEEVNP